MKMRVKEILESHKQEIINLYQNGISTCELGKKFGVSNASIYLFLRDVCKIQIRKTTTIEDYKDEITRMHSEGKSAYFISKQLGLSNSTVSRYCKTLGLDLSDKDKNRADKIKDRTSEIIADYENGMGCTRLAAKYDCAETSITRLLRDNNIDVKYLKTYDVPHHFFDDIDNEDKAYILGFFVGDGCNRDGFQIGICDKELLEDIRIRIGYCGPISESQPKNKDWQKIYKLSFKSHVISHRLSLLGCPPKKTFVTKLPSRQDLPEHLFHHYVRGLFDSDGSIYFVDGTPCITVAGTEELLLGVAGLISYLTGIQSRIYKHGKIRILRITNKQDIVKFGGWLYKDATICLQRKRAKFDEIAG